MLIVYGFTIRTCDYGGYLTIIRFHVNQNERLSGVENNFGTGVESPSRNIAAIERNEMIDTDRYRARYVRICGAKLKGGELLPEERNNMERGESDASFLFLSLPPPLLFAKALIKTRKARKT